MRTVQTTTLAARLVETKRLERPKDSVAAFDTEHSLDADNASEKSFVPELSISPKTSSPLSQLTLISRLCNGAKFEGNTKVSVSQRTIKGDPTDTAVPRFAGESLHKCLLLDNIADLLPLLLDEIPFNSRNKWMMSVIQDNTKTDSNGSESWMLIKGTPDVCSLPPHQFSTLKVNLSHSTPFIKAGYPNYSTNGVLKVDVSSQCSSALWTHSSY